MVLLKKLAMTEHERDKAQAEAARHAAGPEVRTVAAASREAGPDRAAPAAPAAAPAPPAVPAAPAAPAEPAVAVAARKAGVERNTGGLSALVNLWNTALTKRPAPRKETTAKPPEPAVGEVFGLEVLNEKATTSVDPVPPARTVPAVVSAPEVGMAGGVAQDSGDPAVHGNTGGLSALVGLWTTAKTLRPFRHKAAEEKSAGPPANPIFGIEQIPEQPAPSRAPAAAEPGEAARKPDRPTPGAPERPNPSWRPEPKPVPPPAPDRAEESGGWLRSLGKRLRPKK